MEERLRRSISQSQSFAEIVDKRKPYINKNSFLSRTIIKVINVREQSNPSKTFCMVNRNQFNIRPHQKSIAFNFIDTKNTYGLLMPK